jgi:hypothetical protein
VAWAIWDYATIENSSRFYYFSLKQNGWELGRFDSGTQRFISTGNTPSLTLDSWYKFTMTQTLGDSSCRHGTALKLSVRIGSIVYPLTAACDTQLPLTGGRIGFYAEDASADYAEISVIGRTLSP